MPESAMCKNNSLRAVTACGESRHLLQAHDAFVSASCNHDGNQTTLEPSTELGRFVIKRHLGRGSLGDVYLAHDAVREQDVAIKVVFVQPHLAEMSRILLQRERALYDQVRDCRHVIRVHDVHAIPRGGIQLLVLSMEYADGGTFRKWLEAHRSDWQGRRTRGLVFFEQICQAVAAIHSAGAHHLDLKPENILSVGGNWKVADFGVSPPVDCASSDQPRIGNGDCTACGVGTPAYMSPEQFTTSRRDDLDFRADIYSLGAILHEIVHPSGRPPFVGSYKQLRELHAQALPASLPGARESETRVVARCLAKNPADRYQSVTDLLADLHDHAVDNSYGNDSETEAAWQEAVCCIERGAFNEARRLCQRILQTCPDHSEVSDLLAALCDRAEKAGQIYAVIEQGLSDRGLDELTTLLVEAATLYPEHPLGHVVQVRLGIKARQYHEAMEEGLRAVQQAEWLAAAACFKRAETHTAGTGQANRATQFVAALMARTEAARQQIDRAIAVGNRDRALALARRIDDDLEAIARVARVHSTGSR